MPSTTRVDHLGVVRRHDERAAAHGEDRQRLEVLLPVGWVQGEGGLITELDRWFS